jgi:hypothetical protein
MSTYTGLVNPARPILRYSLLRAALFAVPFVILMILGIWWWVSALAAAIIAACLSFLFLNRQRDAVSETVHGWRQGGTSRDDDNEVENAVLDDNEGRES